MANMCDNYAVIKHINKETLEKFYNDCVAECSEHVELLYNIAHNVIEVHNVEMQDGAIILNFDSKWSPPIDTYNKLQERGFEIQASYFEGGVGICGYYNAGQQEEFSINDGDYSYVPKELIERHAIDECYNNQE